MGQMASIVWFVVSDILQKELRNCIFSYWKTTRGRISCSLEHKFYATLNVNTPNMPYILATSLYIHKKSMHNITIKPTDFDFLFFWPSTTGGHLHKTAMACDSNRSASVDLARCSTIILWLGLFFSNTRNPFDNAIFSRSKFRVLESHNAAHQTIQNPKTTCIDLVCQYMLHWLGWHYSLAFAKLTVCLARDRHREQLNYFGFWPILCSRSNVASFGYMDFFTLRFFFLEWSQVSKPNVYRVNVC